MSFALEKKMVHSNQDLCGSTSVCLLRYEGFQLDLRDSEP